MPLFLFPRERHCNTGEPVRSVPLCPLSRSDNSNHNAESGNGRTIHSLCRRYFYPLMYYLTSYVDDGPALLATTDQPTQSCAETKPSSTVPFLLYEEVHMTQLQTWLQHHFEPSDRGKAQTEDKHIQTELEQLLHINPHFTNVTMEQITQRLATERHHNMQNCQHNTQHLPHSHHNASSPRPFSSSYALPFLHVAEVEHFVHFYDAAMYKKKQDIHAHGTDASKAIHSAFALSSAQFIQCSTAQYDDMEQSFHHKSFLSWCDAITGERKRLTESLRHHDTRAGTEDTECFVSHVQSLLARPCLVVEAGPPYPAQDEKKKKKKKQRNSLFVHWPDVLEDHFSCLVAAAAGKGVEDEMLRHIFSLTARTGYSTLRDTYLWYYLSHTHNRETDAKSFESIASFVLQRRNDFTIDTRDEVKHCIHEESSFLFCNAMTLMEQPQDHGFLLKFHAPTLHASGEQCNLSDKLKSTLAQIEKDAELHQPTLHGLTHLRKTNARPLSCIDAEERQNRMDLSFPHDGTTIGQSMNEGQRWLADGFVRVTPSAERRRAHGGITELDANVCRKHKAAPHEKKKSGCDGRKRARSPREEVPLLGDEEQAHRAEGGEARHAIHTHAKQNAISQRYGHLPFHNEPPVEGAPTERMDAMEGRMIMEFLRSHTDPNVVTNEADAEVLAHYVLLPRLLGVHDQPGGLKIECDHHYAFFSDISFGDKTTSYDRTFGSMPSTDGAPFCRRTDSALVLTTDGNKSDSSCHRSTSPTEDAHDHRSREKRKTETEPVDIFSQYLFNFAKEKIEGTSEMRQWRSLTTPIATSPEEVRDTREKGGTEEGLRGDTQVATEFRRLLTKDFHTEAEVKAPHEARSTNDKMLAQSRQLLQQREMQKKDSCSNTFYQISLARFEHRPRKTDSLFSLPQGCHDHRKEETIFYLADQFVCLAVHVASLARSQRGDATAVRALHRFLTCRTSSSLRALAAEGQYTYDHILLSGMRREYFLHFFTYVYDIMDLAWREAFPCASDAPAAATCEDRPWGSPQSLLRPPCLLWYREEKEAHDVSLYLPHTAERRLTAAEAAVFFADLLRSIPHWGCWRHVGRPDPVASYVQEVQLLYTTWRPIVRDLVSLLERSTVGITTAATTDTPYPVLCKLYRPRVFKTVFTYGEEHHDEVQRMRWAWERRHCFLQVERTRAKEASRKRRREAMEATDGSTSASTTNAPHTSVTLSPSTSRSTSEEPLPPCVTLPPSVEASFDASREFYSGHLQRWLGAMHRLGEKLAVRHSGLSFSLAVRYDIQQQQQQHVEAKEEDINDSTVFFSYVESVFTAEQKMASQFYQSISS